MKFIVLFSLLFSFASLAQPSATRVDSSCITNEQDPYDYGYVPTNGPFVDRCIQTNLRRTARKIHRKDRHAIEKMAMNIVPARFYNTRHAADYIMALNIHHQNQFYYAVIDLRGLEKVVFLMQHFKAPVPAGHVLLRFDFNENFPVRLIAQNTNSQERVTLTSLVFSAEAVYPEGEHYDLARGILRTFPISYRITSWAQKWNEMIEVSNNPVEQYLLSFDAQESRDLLSHLFDYTSLRRQSRWYNTLQHSCSTVAFDLIDHMIPLRSAWARSNGGTMISERWPNQARHALEARGIFAREWPTLNPNGER